MAVLRAIKREAVERFGGSIILETLSTELTALERTRVDTKAMTQHVVPESLQNRQIATSLGGLSDMATLG